MKGVIVLGTGSGLGASLAAALRASGAVLIVSGRMEQPPPDPFELGAGLLVDSLRLPQPERPQFYPEARPNLPKSAISQVPGIQRTGRRAREQRTKGQR